MRQPLLEVTNLSVRFDTDDGPVYAVDGLSFSLEPGEVLGMVGESGCGKSTTCLALVRLLPETAAISGRVALDGVDLLALTARELREVRRHDVSFVFQEPATSLNPVLTVGAQIAEVVRRHSGLSRRDARVRTIELLRLVHISAPEARAGAFPHQLSGGMRQRVMIAMALACDPKVLIADEPTTALDVTIQAGILDLLADIRDRLGTAIVLVTHSLGVVAAIADRVLVMYAGRTAEEAPTADLFARPQHPYTIGLLGATPRRHGPDERPSRLHEIPGHIPSSHVLPAGCAFADRCPRADEVTCAQLPALTTVGPRHRVTCFRPGLE
jgi:peptide/nickel transport system ATP-binding protein